MKKLIYKTLFFLSIVFVLIAIFYVFSFYKKQNEIVKISKKNLVIGDSNTRWSISDSILSDYANYSVGGETYLFAYTKLKILEKDNKIDTLMLSFNPHNLINNMWWDDSAGSSVNNRMPSFYQNFTLENHLDMMQVIPKNYIKSLSKIGNQEITNFFSFNKKEDPLLRFGSYKPETQNETQFKPTPYLYKEPKITSIEIKYLDKIIEDCKEKNIHLILIQPPKNYLRKDYENYAHQEFYDYYYQHYRHVDFLDFSKLQLPKHAYWDIMHVDIVGAEYFSNFLKNNGIKNLLQSKYNLKNDHR